MNRNIILGAVIAIIVISLLGVFFYNYYSQGNNSAPTTSSSSPSSKPSPQGLLVISIADAYKGEGDSLGKAFQSLTGVQYTVASSGSFALARQIASGSLSTTVFIPVADSAAFPKFMGNYSPGWVIGLATDQMVIAYSNQTLRNPTAAKIIQLFNESLKTNSSQLYFYAFGNLTSGQVKVGISNPLLDPAGYRGWLVLQMAGYLYAKNESYFVDRMLNNGGNVTAAHAADLIPGLQTGQIQFLFIYKSAAVAQGLKYIQLPPQLNLGDPKYSSFYSQFQYKAGNTVLKGGLIVLWITIPKNSNNPNLAVSFVNFTLNHLDILASYGLTPLQKPILEIWVPQNELPPFVQSLINSGKVQVVQVNPS